MIFNEIEITNKLFKSWSKSSSSLWTSDNPAAGQCGVTAFLIYQLFGGKLLKTPIGNIMHFYNEINGISYDFTKSQFSEPIEYKGLFATEEDIFSQSTYSQYENLKGVFFEA